MLQNLKTRFAPKMKKNVYRTRDSNSNYRLLIKLNVTFLIIMEMNWL